MIVRVGLPKSVGALPLAVERLGAPALVSAGSLWDHERGKFRAPGMAIGELDCALDSGGFVAMRRFGGYRWTVADYVELACRHSWAWWAQMDLCCEPEIAAQPFEVRRRVFESAVLLGTCRKQVRAWRDAWTAEPIPGVPSDALDASAAATFRDPVPVLQGWEPEHYAESAEWVEGVLQGEWPALVGVGSVCRRRLSGRAGLFAVLDRVDRVLPPGVQVHLFGVKGAALQRLAGHPRVASVDSAAWDYRARKTAHHEGVSNTNARRVDAMQTWLTRQETRPASQVALFA